MAAQIKMLIHLGFGRKGSEPHGGDRGGLRAMGKRHLYYGVKRGDYDKLSNALIQTLKEFFAGEFTVELEHAWVSVYGMVAETMIEASEN
jgi:hemoglobin-like flavoprotein